MEKESLLRFAEMFGKFMDVLFKEHDIAYVIDGLKYNLWTPCKDLWEHEVDMFVKDLFFVTGKEKWTSPDDFINAVHGVYKMLAKLFANMIFKGQQELTEEELEKRFLALLNKKKKSKWLKVALRFNLRLTYIHSKYFDKKEPFYIT